MKAAIYARYNIITIFVIALLLLPLIATAADKLGNYETIMNTNESTCGRYVSARDEARNGNHFRENMYRYWLAGYVTAFNKTKPDTWSIIGTTDLDSAMLWLENYCKQYPLEDFSDATNSLVYELYPKRVKQRPK